MFGFCITHILNIGCAKFWKKKSVAKRLSILLSRDPQKLLIIHEFVYKLELEKFDCNIYAHLLLKTRSQRYLKISRPYHASNATEHGPVFCHDKAQFPISCWQCDRDLLFIVFHITRRRDWLSSWTSVCLFSVFLLVYVSLALCLHHTHHFIYPILSSLHLDALFHYIRFILKPLSSPSTHMSVLTDSLSPS